MTDQEKRIFRLAEEIIPLLKKKEQLSLRAGRWEIGYDFAKAPRLIWQFNASQKEAFAIIPSKRRIVGLGPLHYGYAEKKLSEAWLELRPVKTRRAG